MTITRCLLILLLLSALAGPSARAHPDDGSAVVADEMAAAANHLLATLTPEQTAKATYPLNDNERFNWHFIPIQDNVTKKSKRKGLPLEAMSAEQKLRPKKAPRTSPRLRGRARTPGGRGSSARAPHR